MEQAVRGIVHRLSTSTEERLAAELESLTKERRQLSDEVERLTRELRAARDAEYVPLSAAAARRSRPPTPPAWWASRPTGWAGCRAPSPPTPRSPSARPSCASSTPATTPSPPTRSRSWAGACPRPSDLPHPNELRADIELIQSQEDGSRAAATGGGRPCRATPPRWPTPSARSSSWRGPSPPSPPGSARSWPPGHAGGIGGGALAPAGRAGARRPVAVARGQAAAARARAHHRSQGAPPGAVGGLRRAARPGHLPPAASAG